MSSFLQPNRCYLRASAMMGLVYVGWLVSLLLIDISLLHASEEISFSPDQRDFVVKFPAADWNPLWPSVKEEGRHREYSSGLFPSYTVTVTDLSDVDAVIEIVNESEKTEEIEQLTTLTIFPQILGQSDSRIADTKYASFRGRFCILYEVKQKLSLYGEISRHPFLSVGAVFSRIEKENKSATVYHVSLFDVVTSREEERNVRREFARYLDTFNFPEPIDYENPRSASVTVYSIPSDATLYVDGRNIGVTPVTFELKLGIHIIELVKEGFHEFAKDIEIVDSVPVNVEYQLTKPGNPPALPGRQ